MTKRILAALAMVGGLMVATAMPASAVDWKPGLAWVHGQNTSHDWQLGYTYRWRSGRTHNGAYVEELAKKIYRMTWVGPGDPRCDGFFTDRRAQGARFKTSVREASGAHNWYHGTVFRECPHDGVNVYKKSYDHGESPNMYFMRTGAPPEIHTHMTLVMDDWPDPDWNHTNRMWYRGRHMFQPW